MRKFLIALSSIVFSSSIAFAGYEETDTSPVENTSATSPLPWDLAVRIYAGQDSNVPLSPDLSSLIGDEDSALIGGALRGTYRFTDTADWLFGVTVRADMTIFVEENDVPAAINSDLFSSPHEYNQWNIQPSVFGVRRFDIDGAPSALGVQFTYRHEETPDISGRGLDAHTLQVSGNTQVSPNVILDFAVGYTSNDFDIVRPNPNFLDRDGELYRGTVGATYRTEDNKRELRVSYSYTENETNGRNWEYTGHKVAARFETQLFGPFWANLDLAYDDRDYSGFVIGFIPAPGRQDSNIWTYGAQLVWPVSEHCMLDLTIKRTEIDANSPFFRTDATRVLAGFTYTF